MSAGGVDLCEFLARRQPHLLAVHSPARVRGENYVQYVCTKSEAMTTVGHAHTARRKNREERRTNAGGAGRGGTKVKALSGRQKSVRGADSTLKKLEPAYIGTKIYARMYIHFVQSI